MTDLTERVASLEARLASVYVGDWGGGDGDQRVPYQVAIRIRTADLQLQASLVGAVHLAAQVKLGQGGEGSGRLLYDIIDNWCGTPHGSPPRPHWGSIVEQLGLLADSYRAGSALHDASLELCTRVVSHVREQSKLTK
jgi:hypothetical protein